MNFLYGAVVLFIEEEDIDEEKEEVEEEEEPFHEAYVERGREGETRSEVLAVKELDGCDGMRYVEGTMDEHGENQAGDEERKKENEPFAVPTAGAFYMHDDRFRDNAGARNRYDLCFSIGFTVYWNVLVLGH